MPTQKKGKQVSHTPGPWTLDKPEQRGIGIREGEDGYIIATVWKDDSGIHSADARLIAAAPELLEAAKEALTQIMAVHPDWSKAQDNLETAIARATGDA